jgi:hypothetical protein
MEQNQMCTLDLITGRHFMPYIGFSKLNIDVFLVNLRNYSPSDTSRKWKQVNILILAKVTDGAKSDVQSRFNDRSQIYAVIGFSK